MATVTGDTGGRGTRAIATRYPPVAGLIAGTTTQTGNKESMEAVGIYGIKTRVNSRDRVGL